MSSIFADWSLVRRPGAACGVRLMRHSRCRAGLQRLQSGLVARQAQPDQHRLDERSQIWHGVQEGNADQLCDLRDGYYDAGHVLGDGAGALELLIDPF